MVDIQQSRKTYIERVRELEARMGTSTKGGLNAEQIVRLQLMNELEGKTVSGIEIARRNARIMRNDMATYEQDNSQFTQSLGADDGFIAQNYMVAAKAAKGGSLDRVYVYGSGWQWAAMSSSMSPKPDTSTHPKDTVPKQGNNIYRFLQAADITAKVDIFNEIDKARKDGANEEKLAGIYAKLDNFVSHIRPIVADIDAGFGNASDTFYLACEMIQSGVCCIQIENQLSEYKQCGHQDGKVTVPPKEFQEHLMAVRAAFEAMGIPDGVIVARTDSLGAGLTKVIAKGVDAHRYNKHLDMREVTPENPAEEGDQSLQFGGKQMKLNCHESGLFKFKENTGTARAIEDMVFAFNNCGADIGWIETGAAHAQEIIDLSTEIRQEVPSFMLAYNNSPSFPWTLNARRMILKEWIEKGDPRATEKAYPNPDDPKDVSLGTPEYKNTPLGKAADEYILQFQKVVAAKAGVFHNLITLPSFHLQALNAQHLAREYFTDLQMFAYTSLVQDREFDGGYLSAAHQWFSTSDVTDYFKKLFGGASANIAAGKNNTQNVFGDLLAQSAAGSGTVRVDEPAVEAGRDRRAG